MPEVLITDFEVMFALHTGVTIMTSRLPAFDDCDNTELVFSIEGSQANDIVVSTPSNQSVIIKDVKKDYLAEALERGFIMVYELEDDEIIRCTPCQLNR